MKVRVHKILIVASLLAALSVLASSGGPAAAADSSVTIQNETTGWVTGEFPVWPAGIWVYPITNINGTEFTAHSRGITLNVKTTSGERIAFAHNGQICTMDTDGGNLNVLANGEYPVLSPDGSKIAFIRYGNGNSDLFIINSDGTDIVRLTTENSWKYPNGWSPDDSKIVFTAWGQSVTEIMTINTNGSGETQLTDTYSITPDWSPNGARIVYEGMGQVWTMNPDGSGKVQLTHTGYNKNPRWSPDGLHIAFESNRDGDMEIYIMAADGSSQTRLTDNNAYDDYPRWSPDGTKIAFASTRDGNWEVYVMNAGGAGQTRLTHNSAYDFAPRWLQNGTDIIFNSIPSTKQIHKISSSGGDEINLTNNADRNELPYFVCSLQKPVGVTLAATNITSNSATLNGNLPDMVGENPVNVFFIFSTIQSNTPGGSGSKTPEIAMTAHGDFHYDLTGLLPDTRYYFSAWDESITEISCSSGELNFMTGNSSDAANLNISVILQGGSRPDAGWVVPLTVKLFTPGTATPADVLTATPVYTFNPTTAKSGSTAVAQTSGIIQGTYDISVVSPGCLTNVRRGVVITGPATDVSLGTLLEGNANDDNKINIQDFGILAAAYGNGSGETGYDARADFDRSGRINIADFGLLAANYARSAPQIDTP